MTIKIYNSLTKKKEEFKPLEEGKIKMYVCGPTVYGPGHIGHARTYIAFDIIRRYLEYKNFKVKYVVNITDVHDDIIKKANEQGITIFELAEKNIKLFFKDMKELGIKPANINPRVTETIDEIIKMIQKLQEKGIAYETEDGVYYAINKFPNYGKLAGIKLDKSKTGTRVETDKYDKDNPQDFVLWKKQKKENEPFWESPWGKGRPGWHIECSAMNLKHLGEQIDIHGGARDLIFPHHQNEIAQSEGITGKQFVKYWMHTGFLNVEGEKMSKSLENFIEIPDLLAKFNAKIFRFFIAGIHYKSRIDFTEKAMQQSKTTLDKLNDFIRRVSQSQGKENSKITSIISNTKTKFEKEMDDDFNTPNALAVIFEFVSQINKLLDLGKLGKENAKQVLCFMKQLNEVFNVFTFEFDETLSNEQKKLIEEREKYRKEKNFAEADKIRDKLLSQGIQLLDTPEGIKWKKL